MSWIERLDSNLTITCGDGKQYTPLWKNPKKSYEFNVSEFNFQGVEGTLVYRKEVMGRQYPIEIYFTGDDNIEQAAAFEESSKNKAPWVWSHPYYDDILGHPVSLNFDNTKENVTKITGTFLETISDVYPRSNVNPKDKVKGQFNDTADALADDFATNVPEPDTTVKDNMTKNNDDLYNAAKSSATNSEDAEAFRKAFSEANSAILTATTAPLAAIRKANDVIGYPADLQATAQARIGILKQNYDMLVTGLQTLTERNQKYVFESNASIILAAMSLAASTPQEGDYEKRTDVLSVAETINDTYSDLLVQLDALQTDRGDLEDSYVPGAAGLRNLSALYNFSIANLLNIALGSAQERTLVLTADDDVINLTHRFYGLDPQDINLNRFIEQNEISINQMLELKVGTQITYVV